MTIYETIKAAISVKQAAKHYGLKVSRNGMACCPFHNDRYPSLKLNEEYFFCFGCGAKGDVIDFVARFFDLSSYEAAQKLASDFGLDPKPPTAAAMVKPKHPYIRQFREDEMMCFRVLTDYLHLLEDWKVRYAPKTPEEVLGDQTIAEAREDCSFIWDNYYYEEEQINEYELSLFLQEEGNLYRKYVETHYQKGYELETVKRLLEKSGMKFITAYDAFTRNPPTKESERVYVIARESGKCRE